MSWKENPDESSKCGRRPSGLGFAALMGSNGSHAITVIERDGKGQTPGWGITLRSHALAFWDWTIVLSHTFSKAARCDTADKG